MNSLRRRTKMLKFGVKLASVGAILLILFVSGCGSKQRYNINYPPEMSEETIREFEEVIKEYPNVEEWLGEYDVYLEEVTN
jgi:hypothetical protein